MGGFSDNEYEIRRKGGTNWRKVLLPVMGLLLLGCAVAISFALSGPATELVRSRAGNLPPGDEIQIAVGFGLFMVMLLVFAVVYALFAPKPKINISEDELAKEKKAIDREKRERKKRNRQMRIDLANERRENEQS